MVIAALLCLVLGTLGAQAEEGSYIGPLSFDPHGADFTAWVDDFKAQLYENWPPKEPAGFPGHVVMEFTVSRDGSVQRVRVFKKVAGGKAVQKAAEAALRSSTFQPLPVDYKRKNIIMRLEFHLAERQSR